MKLDEGGLEEPDDALGADELKAAAGVSGGLSS